MQLEPMHVHLFTNHIPILGTIFCAVVLGWGWFFRRPDVTRLGLALTVAVALLTIPVFLTGEPAEHALRGLMADFPRELAHEHEERGELTFYAVMLTGAAALVALWLGRRRTTERDLPAAAVLALLLVSAGLAGWTALAGGVIRHEELRPAAAAEPGVPPAPAAEPD